MSYIQNAIKYHMHSKSVVWEEKWGEVEEGTSVKHCKTVSRLQHSGTDVQVSCSIS